MSIVTGVRSRADSTLEQGRSTLRNATERAHSLRGDTLELALGVITRARRQAYLTIGASDAILATVTKRGQELPGDAKQGAAKLVDKTKGRIDQAGELAALAQDKVVSVADELKERGTLVANSARNINLAGTTAGAKDKVQGRVAQVTDGINKLADRGEQIVVDLRHDPVLVRLIRGADQGVERAANQATSIAQKVRTRSTAQAKRESAAATSTPFRVTPANKIPAHTSTVRKTPAGEAPISPIPTHRAAAYDTATRKAAAQKAAATRKAAAAEEAATRKAAAAKAAATRKAAAEARQEAVETRKAAAIKAAATRKANSAKKATPRNASARKAVASVTSAN
jgi:hypothetical protein